MKPSRILFAVLLMPLLFAGCHGLPAVDFSNLKQNSADLGYSYSPGEYYVKGTLNGKSINWQATNDINGFIAGPVSGLQTSGGTSDVQTASTQGIITKTDFKPNIGIEFGFIKVNPGESHEVKFNSFLTTGAWNFAPDLASLGNDKWVTVNYADEQGNTYDTMGAQTQSLNVVSVTKIASNKYHGAMLKVKVTFSCTLYPDFTNTNGTAITFSNAEATVLLEDPFFQ